MKHQGSLFAPRHWPTWFGMGLGCLLGWLPYRLQMWLGRRLGDLAWWIVPYRRHVAATNLAMSFPELDADTRRRMLRDHFRSVGMGAMETLICWWAPAGKIERLTDMEGLQHLEAAAARGQGMLLLSAHFTSLELGVRMAQLYLKRLGIRTTAMYRPPHNAVVDTVMRKRREHHIGGASIPDSDVRGLLRALKRGDAVWYAADQKASNQFSADLTFFGQPARTSLATGRLVARGNAVVVPFFTLRRADNRGYRLLVQPPLEGFPSGDDEADAQRLNDMIEAAVREAPAQYFWLHQRYKREGVDPYRDALKDPPG